MDPQVTLIELDRYWKSIENEQIKKFNTERENQIFNTLTSINSESSDTRYILLK